MWEWLHHSTVRILTIGFLDFVTVQFSAYTVVSSEPTQNASFAHSLSLTQAHTFILTIVCI